MAQITEISTKEKLAEQLQAIKDLKESGIAISPDQLENFKKEVPHYLKYKAEIDKAFTDVYAGQKTPQQALAGIVSGQTTPKAPEAPSVDKNAIQAKLREQLEVLVNLKSSGAKMTDNLVEGLKQEIPGYSKNRFLIVDAAFNKVLSGYTIKQVMAALFLPPIKEVVTSKHLYGDIWFKAGVGFMFHNELSSSWMLSTRNRGQYNTREGEFNFKSTFPDVLSFPLTLSGNLYSNYKRSFQLFWLIDVTPQYFPKAKISFTNVNAGLGLAAPVELGSGWALPFRFAFAGGFTVPGGRTETNFGGNFFGEMSLLEKVWGKDTLGSVELFIRGGMATQESLRYFVDDNWRATTIPKHKSKFNISYGLVGLRFGFGDRINPVKLKKRVRKPLPSAPTVVVPDENKFLHLKDKLKPAFVQTGGDKKAKGNRNKTVLSQAKNAKTRSSSPTIFPNHLAKKYGYMTFELDVIDVDHTSRRKDLKRPSRVYIVPSELGLPADQALSKEFVSQLVEEWALLKGLSNPEKYFFSYIPDARDSKITAKLSPEVSYRVIMEAGDNGNKRKNANRFDNFLVRTKVAHGGLTSMPPPITKKTRFRTILVDYILKHWDKITPTTDINLMFVIDSSGSMNQWVTETQNAVAGVISNLRDLGIKGNIRISLRTFVADSNKKCRGGFTYSSEGLGCSVSHSEYIKWLKGATQSKTLMPLILAGQAGLGRLRRELLEINFSGFDEIVGQAISDSITLFARYKKDLNLMFVLTDKDGLEEGRYESMFISQKDATEKARRKNIIVNVIQLEELKDSIKK